MFVQKMKISPHGNYVNVNIANTGEKSSMHCSF